MSIKNGWEDDIIEKKLRPAGPCVQRGLPCYDAALAELRKLLADCVKNRDDVDPELEDEKWKGFIQGVEMSIYRLDMHNASQRHNQMALT